MVTSPDSFCGVLDVSLHCEEVRFEGGESSLLNAHGGNRNDKFLDRAPLMQEIIGLKSDQW